MTYPYDPRFRTNSNLIEFQACGPLTMKIAMYLYSVVRKETAPSLIASWRSAAFCTICAYRHDTSQSSRRLRALATGPRPDSQCFNPYKGGVSQKSIYFQTNVPRPSTESTNGISCFDQQKDSLILVPGLIQSLRILMESRRAATRNQHHQARPHSSYIPSLYSN
jgi:hypothetical protein